MTRSGFLFGEGMARYIVIAGGSKDAIFYAIEAEGDTVGCLYLGYVEEAGEPAINFVSDARTGEAHSLSLDTLRAAHEGWLPGYMKGQ